MSPITDILYLGIHAGTTLGALFVFFLRIESRMARTEENLRLLREEHNRVLSANALTQHK